MSGEVMSEQRPESPEKPALWGGEIAIKGPETCLGTVQRLVCLRQNKVDSGRDGVSKAGERGLD